MNRADKTTPHADHKGLLNILGGTGQVAPQIIANDTFFTNLIDIGQGDKLRQFDGFYSVDRGERVGEMIDTTGKVIIPLLDSDFNTASVAIFTPNSEQTPDLTEPSQPHALFIGDPFTADEIWVTDDKHKGMGLYIELAITQKLKVAIGVSPNPFMFNNTVKAFAEKHKVTITDTLEKKAQLVKTFKGHNITAVLTECIPLHDIMSPSYDGVTYASVMATAKVIDLKAEGWDKPKPINQTLPPVKTFTKEIMPDIIWNYSYDCANRMSAPIEYVLIPLMVGLGSVIGAKVTIYPKARDSWESACNFYGVTIGSPSSKKSPTLSDALSPISYLEALAEKKHQEDSLEYQVQKEVNKQLSKVSEKELESLTKQMASQADDLEDSDKISLDDLKAKAQALAEAKQADELIPDKKRYSTNDGNMESIGELESKHKNGILIIRDELTGWFATLDGDKNSQPRSFILEGYNGLGSFKVDRIGRGHIPIATHCLSVIGSMQPDKLEYYLNKTMKGLGNDGFIQRFQLMVYPDPLPNAKEKDLLPDKQSRDDIYSLFETIDNMQLGDFMRYGANPIDDYHKRPYYRFDDKAYPIFMNWYDDLKAKADNAEHGIIAEHLIKYSKTVPALALIFHLIDCIAYDQNLGAVSDHALKAAIAWCEVLETHMLRVYSLVIDSANLKASHLSKKLLTMIKRGTDKTDITDWIEHGFTARQIIRKGWKGLTEADDVQNALEVLIENDWLRWERIESTGQGGRPTERYYINPRISELI